MNETVHQETLSTSQGLCIISVGHQILTRLPTYIKSNRVFLLSDSFLHQTAIQLQQLLSASGISCTVCEIPAVETSKSIEAVYPLYESMLQSGLDRSSTLVALGGGVIGDIGGFLAGTFLRGIDWIGIPSTLLAQVDSSIGGKTGINHPLGKNLIGVFHQPTHVICDLSLLQTLPKREMISGLGEVIKYGLIGDASFFTWVMQHWQQILSYHPSHLHTAVLTCIQHKASRVTSDEKDLTGIRETLNFGHTIGHALEAAGGYSDLRHGEAVLYGMRAAVFLSYRKNILTQETFTTVDKELRKIPVPPWPAWGTAETLLPFLQKDKKVQQGKLRFILLSDIGKVTVCNTVTQEEIKEVVQFLCSEQTTF